MKTPLCLAADIGGTKIAMGWFDPQGNLHGEMITDAVPFEGDGRASADGLIQLMRPVVEQRHFEGVDGKPCAIGLSICGNVEMESGVCSLVPNLHWRGVPFGGMVQDVFGLPVFAATDTRQAAMAEHLWGAGRGVPYFCWCTVGTGFGGYLYLDGRPYDGFHGIAGPFGHNTIDEVNGHLCGCGKRGCVETYVAGPALARAGQAAAAAGESALLVELAAGRLVTTPMVVRAYQADDPASKKIIDQAARLIAISLSGVNNLLDLQMFILGGGVVNALPDLVAMVDHKMREYLMSQEARQDVRVVRETFPNSSLYGAAAHAFVQCGIISDA
jgi:glucokinase